MGPRRLHLSERATSERKLEGTPTKKNIWHSWRLYQFSLTISIFSEQLLAVPEEEAWSEEETSRLLLLDTEAPGTPEKDTYGASHETEYGVTATMAAPTETAPPMLENARKPLK